MHTGLSVITLNGLDLWIYLPGRVEDVGLIYMYRSVWVKQGDKEREEGKDESGNSERVLDGGWKALKLNPGKMVSLSF